MGTTLTALQGSGLKACFVIAIEGYEYLITDLTDPTILFTSGTGWDGTDWSQALGGLNMAGSVFQQGITPWDSAIRGSEMRFQVMDFDGNDTFAKAVFQTGAGNQTPLHQTLNNTYSVGVKVKDTTNFASSGSLFVGCEHITYTSKTAGIFGGTITRGKYSPFKTDSGAAFGRNHKVSTKEGTVVAPILVTDKPRNWMGRWCGIWLHRVTGSTVDTKANAELLHAGRIVGIQDTSSGSTQIVVSSVLDTIRDTTICYDQYVGKVRRGIYIDENYKLSYRSYFRKWGSGTSLAYEGATWRTFDATTSDLTHGSWYTVDEWVNIFNKWLNDRVAAGEFHPGISCGIVTKFGGQKVVLNQEEYASPLIWHKHGLKGRRKDLQMLGWDVPGWNLNEWIQVGPDDGWELAPDNLVPDNEPIRIRAFQGCGPTGTLELEFADGEWVDNTDDMPTFVKNQCNITGDDWGILKIGDNYVVAQKTSNTEFNPLYAIPALSKVLGPPLSPLQYGNDGGMGDVRYSEASELEVKQVVMLEGSLKDLMCKMLATTGVDGFNESNLDMGTSWGSHMGAAIPYSLFGSNFEDSVSGLDLASNTMMVVLDKPTSFGKLFLSDLTLRAAYFIFRRGTVRLISPQTAVSSLSTHTLTEDNKATPAGQTDLNRTPTQITEEFMRNVFKLKYARDVKTGSYGEEKTFMFQSSISDFGEAKPITVSARNSYAGPDATNSAEQLAINVISRLLPAWGKPMQRLRRTVDMGLYLDVAPGDICVVTDSFARNPEDGTRGITNKPALVLAHSFAVTGGLMGEIDLLIGAIDDVTAYAPTAKIDETQTNAGYTSGTPSITVKANEFSVAIDSKVDAAHFEDGDLITIEEISPSDPASTTSWDREVASVSGNVITLTSALSSPAWDSNKQYNVFSQGYSSAQATQQIDCYQADDSDHRIVNTENPRNYGTFNETITLSAPAATDLPEKHSNSWFGDGAPLTTVAHHNIGRMVNNLIGYKTAQKGACFHPTGTAITGETSSASYKLVKCYPVYVGEGTDPPNGARTVTIAPFFRATGASGCYVRVTLSKAPPKVDPASSSPSTTDTEFDLPFAQAAFLSNSASFAEITAQTLPCIRNATTGITYVSIELKGSGTHAAVFWGLSRFEVNAPGV